MRIVTTSDFIPLSSPYRTESRLIDRTMDVVRPATTSPQGNIEPSPTTTIRPVTVTSYNTMKMAVVSSISASISGMSASSVIPSPTPLSDKDSLEHNLNHVLESLFVEDLMTTTYNLNSILRDVGNQTVELEISEVYNNYNYICLSRLVSVALL